MRSLFKALATIIAALAMVAVGTGAAMACTSQPPPKEVTACWKAVNPDFSQPNKADWPQTYVGETCPDSLPACEKAKFQFDKYWIKDDADAKLFDELKANGLDKGSNGVPQDTPLSPHDYQVFVLDSTDQCTSPTASYKVKKYRGCSPTKRFAEVTQRHHIARVSSNHNKARTVWHFKGYAKSGFTFKDGSVIKSRTVHITIPKRCGDHPHSS